MSSLGLDRSTCFKWPEPECPCKHARRTVNDKVNSTLALLGVHPRVLTTFFLCLSERLYNSLWCNLKRAPSFAELGRATMNQRLCPAEFDSLAKVVEKVLEVKVLAE
jgi:hypothetical protein